MAISFVGASATAFPTHAVGDLLVVAAWGGSEQSTPSGWTSAHQSVFDEETLGVYYRIATATNTAAPSVANEISQGLLVYRGANTTDPIGAVASSEGQLPALTLQDASGSSWVACSGVDMGGMPSSVSGLTRRVDDPPYGASFDTNGGVSSFTAKNIGIYIGVSIEIRGGEQKSTAGAVSLAVTPTSAPAKSRSLTNPVVGNVLENVPMNGTFETNLSGWFSTFFGETLSAISRDTTVKRTGTASMKVEARRDFVGSDGVFDSGETWYQVMNTAAHINGAAYRVTAWVYLDASCDQVWLSEFFGSIPSATTTAKGVWTQLVIEGVSVRDPLDIVFRCDGVNAVFWVDDVKVERVMEPLDVALTVVGEVVKAEGEIKPVTSGITLETLQVDAFTEATLFANSGLMLDLGAAGVMAKAADIAGATSLGVPPAGVPSKHVNRAGAVGLNLNPTGSVSRGEENLGGLITRLVAYTPNGAKLGPLPGVSSWTVTFPYGEDNGSLNITYSKDAPSATLFETPIEVALEVFDGKVFVEQWDSRWLLLESNWNELDLTAERSASGVGMGFRFAKTVVADGPTDGTTVGERRFTSATAGRILTTLSAEAKARGALAGVDVSTFNVSTDSSGNAWSQVMSIGFSVGTPMNSVIAALVQNGMIEVRWDGRIFKVFDAESSSQDKTTLAQPVTLHAGRDFENAPVRKNISDIASVAVVRGDEGVSVEVTNPAVATPWGRWETVLEQGGIVELDALANAGELVMGRLNVGREEHTRALRFNGAKYFPLLNYNPGDWIYSVLEGSATRAKYRVRQITLDSNQDGMVSGSVVLNDRIVEEDVKIKRRLDGVQGGATNAGPRPRPVEGDSTTPNAPTNLMATTSVYMDNKIPRAQVSLMWNDPTKNTDGTDLTDLNVIQVWAKPSRTGTTWRFLTSAPAGANAVTYDPLEVSQSYSFRLTAIDFTGHTSGYSNTVTLNMGSDVTAPPTPSAPQCYARNGVIEISFNGSDNTGNPMPVDFDHVEVYARNTSSITATSTYRVGTIAADASSLTLAKWPYNSTLYARFVAVDVSGNKSALSPVSAGVTNSQVGSGDIGGDAVGPGELDIPAIDSAGNLNVNQLTGKTINGVYINGGVFVSTNTSQRVEIGNTGDGDPTDEVRMFNSGTVVSIRNNSSAPGSMRVNANGRLFDFDTSSDGAAHGILRVAARGTWKWVSDGFQARNNSDSGYLQLQASAFLVSSKEEFKKNIRPAAIDSRAALKATSARRYRYKWDDEPDSPNQGEQLGLMAEELPDEVRAGDGYSVTAVVALLWDALREANERIEKLEKGKS